VFIPFPAWLELREVTRYQEHQFKLHSGPSRDLHKGRKLRRSGHIVANALNVKTQLEKIICRAHCPPTARLFLFAMHFHSLLGLLSTTSLFCNVAYALSHIAPNDLAAQYKLSTSTVLPFPSTTQATKDAQNLILDKWSLGKGRIQDGADNLAFVNDPFPGSKPAGTQDTDSSTSGPVLQVKYPGNNTGGSQFYTLWNTTDGSKFNTMLLSYEVAIENAFDWGKGGKLPGLRGGLVSHGCSGSEKSDGKECFSARLGWRKDGDGEGSSFCFQLL